MQVVSVTTKGQTTIPADIRRKQGIRAKDKVLVYEDKGEIKIKKVQDFFSLKGSVKVGRLVSKREEKEAAQRYVANHYLAKKKKIEKYG